jgi:hypothetical protein
LLKKQFHLVIVVIVLTRQAARKAKQKANKLIISIHQKGQGMGAAAAAATPVKADCLLMLSAAGGSIMISRGNSPGSLFRSCRRVQESDIFKTLQTK